MTSTSESMPAEVRRERMLSLVQDQDFVRIAALAEAFGVSVVTVRGDLDALEAQGLIRRVRGGARSVPLGLQSEPSFEQSLGSSALEKVAIAKAATALVTSGQSIVIDAGSTTAFFARELVARRDLTDLVVFTNSLSAAHELEPAVPRFTVVLSGGTLRSLQHSLVDPMGGRILENIHADIAFLSCSGIHPETGVTNINIAEAEMKIRMLRATSRHILLADSSKLDRTDLAPVCPLTDIDLLITGDAADETALSRLRDRGLSTEIATLSDRQ
ncbi:DeoR/GlpR family DNA-binding transcription regulator [Actinoallomurus rhizosphaericola]|uniref:DeoR/GlpR family DNA-binding transcription regulator n=1 Tax=Actinoallomurus rhizosphaericola TaxID=2952536 RepID=UPI0020900A19|nr:DeoR/GlpR family DNA-binding transcription regulator [Actinoallomurus rhizosphaericola]MCO5992858.1 DeoR/GlpR family DNA-binding transcription regulator [Actinoallomurus rhizosphaericola]